MCMHGKGLRRDFDSSEKRLGIIGTRRRNDDSGRGTHAARQVWLVGLFGARDERDVFWCLSLPPPPAGVENAKQRNRTPQKRRTSRQNSKRFPFFCSALLLRHYYTTSGRPPPPPRAHKPRLTQSSAQTWRIPRPPASRRLHRNTKTHMQIPPHTPPLCRLGLLRVEVGGPKGLELVGVLRRQRVVLLRGLDVGRDLVVVQLPQELDRVPAPQLWWFWVGRVGISGRSKPSQSIPNNTRNPPFNHAQCPRTSPAGMRRPGGTTEPAASCAPVSTSAPSDTTAPIPIRALSSIVAEVMVAPWPAVRFGGSRVRLDCCLLSLVDDTGPSTPLILPSNPF